MSLRTVLFCFKGHIIPDMFIHPTIIDIIVCKSDQHVSSMHTCTCQNADQMSNSIDHYQTAPDLGVHCLFRYISVPIFGVNTVSYSAASVTNTTIY